MKTRWVLFPAILTAFVFPVVIVVTDVTNNHEFKTTREAEWSIGIYEGENPLDLKNTEDIQNPVLRATDVKDVKAKFVADPFIFKKDSMVYMFFEVFNELTDQGDIGLATSKDSREWQYQKIVLDEPFHISYPFVFDYNNEIYMIPESAEAQQIRLYKAIQFPYKWQYERTLLKGNFGDHALFRHDNVWWLFAGADPSGNSSLRLFFADSLSGNWVEHIKSPIVKKNPNKARPGGRIIEYNGRMYRLAQDCKPTYGSALNAYEIIKLTKDTYEEKDYSSRPLLEANGKGWARHGMHQLDTYTVGGKWYGCVDGYRKNFVIRVDY